MYQYTFELCDLHGVLISLAAGMYAGCFYRTLLPTAVLVESYARDAIMPFGMWYVEPYLNFRLTLVRILVLKQLLVSGAGQGIRNGKENENTKMPSRNSKVF